MLSKALQIDSGLQAARNGVVGTGYARRRCFLPPLRRIPGWTLQVAVLTLPLGCVLENRSREPVHASASYAPAHSLGYAGYSWQQPPPWQQPLSPRLIPCGPFPHAGYYLVSPSRGEVHCVAIEPPPLPPPPPWCSGCEPALPPVSLPQQTDHASLWQYPSETQRIGQEVTRQLRAAKTEAAHVYGHLGQLVVALEKIQSERGKAGDVAALVVQAIAGGIADGEALGRLDKQLRKTRGVSPEAARELVPIAIGIAVRLRAILEALASAAQNDARAQEALRQAEQIRSVDLEAIQIVFELLDDVAADTDRIQQTDARTRMLMARLRNEHRQLEHELKSLYRYAGGYD